MFDAITLAENIQKYRKVSGLSQREMAKKLFVSPQAVSKWECGTATPDIERLSDLAELLNVSVDRLLSASEEEPSYIGIDGGGTKTEAVLFRPDGTVLKKVTGAGCNPNAIGMDETILRLENLINELLKENTSVYGIYAGVAGFFSGNYKAEVKKALEKSYRPIKVWCESDIFNVIAGATDAENCVAAICGTGSVVYAKTGDTLCRYGGWGYLLDHRGSAFDIGREALRASLAEREGTGPKTQITRLVEKKLGKKTWDSIAEIYKGGNAYIASFAPLVSEAFRKEDKVAEEILRAAAERMAELINEAVGKGRAKKPVILSGGMVTKDAAYREMIYKYLKPNCRPILSDMPQVYGALIRCLKYAGVSVGPIRERFAETYAKERK